MVQFDEYTPALEIEAFPQVVGLAKDFESQALGLKIDNADRALHDKNPSARSRSAPFSDVPSDTTFR